MSHTADTPQRSGRSTSIYLHFVEVVWVGDAEAVRGDGSVQTLDDDEAGVDGDPRGCGARGAHGHVQGDRLTRLELAVVHRELDPDVLVTRSVGLLPGYAYRGEVSAILRRFLLLLLLLSFVFLNRQTGICQGIDWHSAAQNVDFRCLGAY